MIDFRRILNEEEGSSTPKSGGSGLFNIQQASVFENIVKPTSDISNPFKLNQLHQAFNSDSLFCSSPVQTGASPTRNIFVDLKEKEIIGEEETAHDGATTPNFM